MSDDVASSQPEPPKRVRGRPFVKGDPRVNLDGRPPHKPTKELRGLVRLVASLGVSRERIAEAMGLGSHRTLEKHYETELKQAKVTLDLAVGATYIQRMLGGRGTEEDPFDWRQASTPMLVHYVKSRMNWLAPVAPDNDNDFLRELPLGRDFDTI